MPSLSTGDHLTDRIHLILFFNLVIVRLEFLANLLRVMGLYGAGLIEVDHSFPTTGEE
jgi:hypothetical protein